MNTETFLKLSVVIMLFCTMLISCIAPSPTPQVDQATPPASDYTGKRILFVDSYHQGYEWSDGIEAGLREVLEGTGVELRTVRMDTKRNTDEAFRENAALQAKAEIEAFQPHVVIAADDNAQKYLVVPYLKDTDLPIVFCGVNWDASIYDYPAANITGMVEVELPAQLIEHLKTYAAGEKVGFVTIDSDTERKVAQNYNERFFNDEMQIYWAKNFEEFKESFLIAQEEVDILIVSNNAGVEWDSDEATNFIEEHTRIPTGSLNDWMAPYVLITLAKSPAEQGEWSGQAALRILDGTPASEIAIVENKKGEMILNLNLAEKLGIVFTPSMLKNAEIYQD